jgi:hypothetical protein
VIRRREVLLAIAVAALFCAAPTPGDVGGCGKTASELSEGDFSYTRKLLDCDRCRSCGIANERCKRACDDPVEGYVRFPPTCRPLVHDGEVCLRALRAASCDDFSRYVDDVSPDTPSECDFCRVPEPQAPAGELTDAGGGS